MSLIKKLRNKLNYQKPEITGEIKLYNKDILSLSGELMLDIETTLDEEQETQKFVDLGGTNVKEIYPDGLPISVLSQVDFNAFGRILKRKQLLPPSYDRNPAEIKIKADKEIPSVELIFKSKTTPSYWSVFIKRYYVSAAKSSRVAYEENPRMSAEWCNFAGRIMWAIERNIRCYLLNPDMNNFE